MSKLSNVRGRITYISSHAKQENLYAVYETTERSFWKELALCNQYEFQKSGTEGKCIEARELIIALPEDLVQYEPEYVLEQFTKHFKYRYGVECISALHHNKTKTNYHIHLIFSERKLLDEPVIKTATRNMFYDEYGKRVRTKKEILDGNGNIRKKCRIVKKGEIYEKMLFTIKDKQFKQERFLEETKQDFTSFINTFVFDEKKKLAVFDKHSPYLATKKIGKNNPKAEQIKTDNWARTEWNRTVDRALVEGIGRDEILRVKREEITEKVQESVKKRGNRPCFFYSIVIHAVDILITLIEKIRKSIKQIATLPDRKDNTESIENIKESSQADSLTMETEHISIQSEKLIEDNSQTAEPAEIIFSDPVDVPTAKMSQGIVNESISPKDDIPPKPEFSMDMEEYERLQEIYRKLVKQENMVIICEKKLGQLQQELQFCKGILQGKRRKELQSGIADTEWQIATTKQCLGDIVKGYGYTSVDEFMRVYHKVKADYDDYAKRLKAWGDRYGMKYVKQQFEKAEQTHWFSFKR